jgi:hypothetical protein
VRFFVVQRGEYCCLQSLASTSVSLFAQAQLFWLFRVIFVQFRNRLKMLCVVRFDARQRHLPHGRCAPHLRSHSGEYLCFFFCIPLLSLVFNLSLSVARVWVMASWERCAAFSIRTRSSKSSTISTSFQRYRFDSSCFVNIK